jgi:hypothetical protein
MPNGGFGGAEGGSVGIGARMPGPLACPKAVVDACRQDAAVGSSSARNVDDPEADRGISGGRGVE